MSHDVGVVSLRVGVVVERAKAKSAWAEYVWRPVAVLPDAPDIAPWTVLKAEDVSATFYAGSAEIALFRTETGNYRDNLATGAPLLWVVLRASAGEPPYALFCVTADPGEGEALTDAGDDLVEPVPMPEPVRDAVAAFVAEHHVERAFTKRKRDRADPERLARRAPARERDEP
jgi:hypothetical protein